MHINLETASKVVVAMTATLLVTSTLSQRAPALQRGDQRLDRYWSHWIYKFNTASIIAIYIFTTWYCLSVDSPAYRSWSVNEAIAATSALGGGYLRRWSMNTLRDFFTFEVAIRRGHRLVTTGPYRFLLHPSYTGLFFGVNGLLYFLGGKQLTYLHCGLAWRSWMFWTLIIPGFIIAIIARMRNEEDVLRRHFGHEWRLYKSTRWRFVPFVF